MSGRIRRRWLNTMLKPEMITRGEVFEVAHLLLMVTCIRYSLGGPWPFPSRVDTVAFTLIYELQQQVKLICDRAEKRRRAMFTRELDNFLEFLDAMEVKRN